MYKIYYKGNFIKSFADRKSALAYRAAHNGWTWDIIETQSNQSILIY